MTSFWRPLSLARRITLSLAIASPRALRLALVVLAPALILAGCNPGGAVSFDAFMNGANEVPPVPVTGTGTATFDVEGQLARYHIRLFGMSSAVTAAHIHGPAVSGINAGIIVTLFGGSAPAPVDGTLVNPASGITWSLLLDLMRHGNAYVNVHTMGNPAGEVRGQIRLRSGLEDR